MPISRTPIIDDDGTGTIGTILDNAWKQEFYNQIDGFIGATTEPAPWTPTDGSGAGLALAPGAFNMWVRSNHLVLLNFDVAWPANASGASAKLVGLPVTPLNMQSGMSLCFANNGTPFTVLVNQTGIIFFDYNGNAMTNANFAGKILRATGMYFV